MRLDKYLKVSRLIKRRTVANEACDNERVSVNGRVQRASYDVRPGDRIRDVDILQDAGSAFHVINRCFHQFSSVFFRPAQSPVTLGQPGNHLNLKLEPV